MALDIPDGFAQIAFRWSLTGDTEPMVSTVGVDLNQIGGPLQQSVDDIADGFLDGFGAAEFFSGWTYLGVVARVGLGGGASATYEAPRSVAGTFTGETMPQNCALLIKKLSAAAGRRNRGRMYLPAFCVAENGVAKNGVIDPAQVTGIQANIDQWLGSNFAWHILHDTVPSVLAPTPISSFILDRIIATQRRRLRR